MSSRGTPETFPICLSLIYQKTRSLPLLTNSRAAPLNPSSNSELMNMFSNLWRSWVVVFCVSLPSPLLFAAGPQSSPEDKPPYANRLIHEKSPYLLQHAHNPVDWYAWGEEAFAKARKENKPIFLSVGYSTCNW